MRSFRSYGKFSAVLIGRGIVRHWHKSLLAGAVGLLTVFLLSVYAKNLESTVSQLSALPGAMPITGKISNLNGSLDANLKIPERTVQGIQDAKEITNVVFTVLLRAGLGVFTLEEWEGNLNFFIVATNNLAGVPGLQREEIRFLDGVDERILETEEAVCMIDRSTMEQNNLALGDTIFLTYFYYHYADAESNEVLIKPLGSGNCRIVGVMEIQEYTGTVGCPHLILPFESARKLFHEREIPFTADSISFTVRDPFALNACKDELHDLRLLPVSKNAEPRFDGNAVTLRDDAFIRAAENLRESLAILKGMLPLVLCMLVFAGYLCSYLLIQDRRTEYAIMRSLGMSWRHCFLILLAENCVIETAACLVGTLAAVLLWQPRFPVLLMADGIVLGAFLLGCAAALGSFGSLSVMAVLGKGD